MADATLQAPTQSLGIGAIISESFSILFKNIPAVIMIGFVPMLISALLSGMLQGWGVMTGAETPTFSSGGEIAMFVISMVLQMGIYGLMIAMLVQFAYDVKLGRSVSIARYFGPALAALVPVMALTIVVTILVMLGFVALIIPGLWLYAVFSIVVPVIVIEKAGFGAMGRSAALTKEFRWPIVGLLVVTWLCMIVIGMLFGVIIGFGVYGFGTGFMGVLIMVLLISVINGITYSLFGIATSLIYARLREIKEGVGVDELASVFE